MSNEPSDFYKNMRNELRDWARSDSGKNNKWVEFLLWAPDLLHLMCKLTIDGRVPVSEKAKLGVAIAYFISPIDLIPEALLGPVGYVDDIALCAYVLNSLINHTDKNIVIENWAGDGDVLQIIKQILAVADEMVGSGLWNKLKKMF